MLDFMPEVGKKGFFFSDSLQNSAFILMGTLSYFIWTYEAEVMRFKKQRPVPSCSICNMQSVTCSVFCTLYWHGALHKSNSTLFLCFVGDLSWDYGEPELCAKCSYGDRRKS
jgi:hypothetical protein